MNYKTKMKIEQIFFGFLMFAGFCSIGGTVGYFLATIQKNSEGKINDIAFIAMESIAFVVIFLSYSINTCLHETGHMIFGLMTGYQFNSLRFGSLMLVKENGKLHFCRYNMPGTSGQCIMTAPKIAPEKMPVVLFNLGGLIINLLVFLIGLAVFLATKDSHLITGLVFLVFALTSLLILITNGIPFTQMGTDGANTIIFHRDIKARIAFCNQLEMVKYLTENYSVREMPAELFSFDKSTPMTNPLVTSQAVSCFNYLLVKKMYTEAKDLGTFILENAKSINQLHEKLLYGELLYITMVIDQDNESAKKQFALYGKEIMKAAGFISVQRILYAYYSLVEVYEEKSAKYAKIFEKSVIKYPYPKDAAIEKEQFDMVAEVLQENDERE